MAERWANGRRGRIRAQKRQRTRDLMDPHKKICCCCRQELCIVSSTVETHPWLSGELRVTLHRSSAQYNLDCALFQLQCRYPIPTSTSEPSTHRKENVCAGVMSGMSSCRRGGVGDLCVWFANGRSARFRSIFGLALWLADRSPLSGPWLKVCGAHGLLTLSVGSVAGIVSCAARTGDPLYIFRPFGCFCISYF